MRENIIYCPEKLDYENIYNTIKQHWTQWAINTNTSRFVIGISGGKDSSVVAALAVKIFGKDKVLGVLMPAGEQPDIKDSIELCNFLDIDYTTINIGDAVSNLKFKLREGLDTELSEQTKTNLPARIRMTTLYAVAQTVGGKVINTCNASENAVGYSTLFGDDCGAYGPLQHLTCSEVKLLGKWLGLPKNLYDKAPSDGLCGKTDEDNLGFSYATLDAFIRTKEINSDNYEACMKIIQKYSANRFKLNLVQLPAPSLFNTIIDNDYISDTSWACHIASHYIWG